MVKGTFHNYVGTDSEWRDTYSKKFFNVLKGWNSKFVNRGSVFTLVSMVTSSERIASDQIEVQVNADPAAIMSTEKVSGEFLHLLSPRGCCRTYPHILRY